MYFSAIIKELELTTCLWLVNYSVFRDTFTNDFMCI